MSKKRFIFFFKTGIMGSFVMVVCITSIGYFIFCVNRKERLGEEQEEFHSYQSLKFHTGMNEYSVSFASLSQDLGENEFISYPTEDGNHILISNLGETEYKCSGTCYCDSTSNKRKSSTLVISKTVNYLLVAISSLIAYSLAEKYFDDFCEQAFSEDCENLSFVRSEIDSCENVDKNTGEEAERTGKITEELLRGKYLCKGICFDNSFENMGYIDHTLKKKVTKMMKKKPCRRLQKEVYIDFDPTPLDTLDYEKANEASPGVKPESIVTLIWAHTDLDKFCTIKSKFTSKNIAKGHLGRAHFGKEYFMCRGYDYNVRLAIHPETVCKRVEE